jgi:hypothetical protein
VVKALVLGHHLDQITSWKLRGFKSHSCHCIFTNIFSRRFLRFHFTGDAKDWLKKFFFLRFYMDVPNIRVCNIWIETSDVW